MALWNPFRRSSVVQPSAIVPASARIPNTGALVPVSGYSTDPEDTLRGEPPTDYFRDLPIAALGRWNLNNIRTALDNHQMGQFLQGAMLTESMLGDGRVQSALNGRLKGITMRHLHVAPVDDSRDAKEAAEWTKWLWQRVLTDDVLDQSLAWTTIMGFGLAQRVWDTCRGRNGEEVWCPYIQPWHPQYTYYDISRRQYVAQTQDGIEYIDPDDPHWWLFTPWGEYRGWLRGALRSCAVPWIVRQYALRDAARFSEVHGLPIKVLKVPSQANSADKSRTTAQIRALGNSSVLTLPQQTGPDGTGWEFELLEARDRSWESFFALIENCDREIQQVIRGTNLTSEVQGGSYAAAQVHEDEDSGYADSDCRKLVESFRSTVQMFLGFNFGWADKCPDMWMEAPDKPDLLQLAQAQQAAVTAYVAAKTAGLVLDAEKFCERFSLPLESVEEVEEPAEPDEGEPVDDGFGDEPDDTDEPEDEPERNARTPAPFRGAGKFNEADHPRRDDGKFGEGGGGSDGGKKSAEPQKKKPLSEKKQAAKEQRERAKRLESEIDASIKTAGLTEKALRQETRALSKEVTGDGDYIRDVLYSTNHDMPSSTDDISSRVSESEQWHTIVKVDEEQATKDAMDRLLDQMSADKIRPTEEQLARIEESVRATFRLVNEQSETVEELRRKADPLRNSEGYY